MPNLQFSSSKCREGITVPHYWAKESGDRRQMRGMGLSREAREPRVKETCKSVSVHNMGRAEHHVLNTEYIQNSSKMVNKLKSNYKLL